MVSEVDLDEVADLLGCGAQWLDVRLADDYERGHAMQALHMPLHLLRLKTRLLNPRRTYLCYCESGKRSASAVFLLTQLGFTAYALRAGSMHSAAMIARRCCGSAAPAIWLGPMDA